jgi:hypothetical protein
MKNIFREQCYTLHTIILLHQSAGKAFVNFQLIFQIAGDSLIALYQEGAILTTRCQLASKHSPGSFDDFCRLHTQIDSSN